MMALYALLIKNVIPNACTWCGARQKQIRQHFTTICNLYYDTQLHYKLEWIIIFSLNCIKMYGGHMSYTDFCGGHIDVCCGKIDLFRVQNRVVHILHWWECCPVYQTEGLFHERCWNFWLFWYQIYDCTLNRTNFTQFWRPKIWQFFLKFNHVNFRVTLVTCHYITRAW